jgi:putative addiction module component (TIGR02574 family)
MSQPADLSEFDSLSIAEKLGLLQALWDRTATRPDPIPITPAQRAALRERLAAYRADGDRGAPWSEVEDRLRQAW